MDPQTPGTQSETGSSPQQAYTPVQHHAPAAASGQPDLAKRAIAVVIDGVIAAAIYTVLSRVFGMVLGGSLVGWMVGNFVGSAAALAFYLARDVAYQGRSPGKKVMGLNVATASGGPITPQESIKRNLTLSISWVGALIMTIPILGTIVGSLVSLVGAVVALYEIYLVVTHQQRVGDKIAGTHVVVDGTPAVAL
ncbi:MAG TPA: RDD family protein [Longimicrobium sp.]|nr:RDD family protein [Longimicrobium sp.]